MSEWDDIEEDVRICGINKKVWREFRKMTERYEQPDLDGFAQAEAEAKQADIPVVETQKHLAKWGLRFEKYASFSKDPIFKRRMFESRGKCFNMMNVKER